MRNYASYPQIPEERSVQSFYGKIWKRRFGQPIGKAFADKHRSAGVVSGDIFVGDVAQSLNQAKLKDVAWLISTAEAYVPFGFSPLPSTRPDRRRNAEMFAPKLRPGLRSACLFHQGLSLLVRPQGCSR